MLVGSAIHSIRPMRVGVAYFSVFLRDGGNSSCVQQVDAFCSGAYTIMFRRVVSPGRGSLWDVTVLENRRVAVIGQR